MVVIQVWLFPITIILFAIAVAFPLSKYLVWIMDGYYKPRSIFAAVERRINTGGQTWQQYATSLITFTIILFIFGFIVLALQPLLPLNPDHKTLLSPSTIFHTAASFATNTDLQHYAGDQHFSNFSQIFFCITNFFLSAAMGLSVMTAVTRALRGDPKVGNFFLDVWRVVVYIFLPIAIIFAIIFMQQGSPMTFKATYDVSTLESKSQTIVTGPVAAFESIKMLGTNGGGFFGMNSAHPYENPTYISNFFNTIEMMLFPFALVFMYGRMLKQQKHAKVIFAVMLAFMSATIVWTIYFDTMQPNPAFTEHQVAAYNFNKTTANQENIKISKIAGLPLDQHLGNLEGKELRFGTAAGATFAAITTDVTCGAVNAEADSLNPLAGLAPLVAMWMNCFFGGKGVGMINMLLFVIIGIFLAGMMVGRSPEYLGKKITAREVKLIIVSLLVHPFMVLLPLGLFAATVLGLDAITNPAAHGFSQMLYQFSSASANNGSAFDGLAVTYGFYNNPTPAPQAIAWDIATGLVMIFSRFLPIIAPLAMAASLGSKKTTPFGIGTLRVDTVTFGFLLAGTLIVIGALLFLPAGVLGPVAEHFGPIPFDH